MIDCKFLPVKVYFSKFLLPTKHMYSFVDQYFYLPQMGQFFSSKFGQFKEMFTNGVIECLIFAYILFVALFLDWKCIQFLIGLLFLVHFFSGQYQKTTDEIVAFSVSVIILNWVAYCYLEYNCWFLLNLYFLADAETYYSEKDLIESEIRIATRLFSLFAHFSLLFHVLRFKNDGFNDDLFMFMIFTTLYFAGKYTTDSFNFQYFLSLLTIIFWASEGYNWLTVCHIFALFLVYKKYAKSFDELEIRDAGNWSYLNDEFMLKIVFVITRVMSFYLIDTSDLIMDAINIVTVSFNEDVCRYYINWFYTPSNNEEEEEDDGFISRQQHRIRAKLAKFSSNSKASFTKQNHGKKNKTEAQNNELSVKTESNFSLGKSFDSESFISFVVFYLTISKFGHIEFILTKNQYVPKTLAIAAFYICYKTIGIIFTLLKNNPRILQKIKEKLLWTPNFVFHFFTTVLLLIWHVSGLPYLYAATKNYSTYAYHKFYCMYHFDRLWQSFFEETPVQTLSLEQEIQTTPLGNFLLHELHYDRQIEFTSLGDTLLRELKHQEFEAIPIGQSLLFNLERDKEFESFPFLNIMFDFMLLQRKENFGDFEVPDLEVKHHPQELNTILFPSEYDYLLEYKKLDEHVLKTMPIWNTLMSKPTQFDEVLDKSLAILSLEWAQRRLSRKYPIFRNVTLKFIRFDQVNDDVKVTLELFVENYTNNKVNNEIAREGDFLEFKFPKSSQSIGIGEYKVDEFCDKTIILSRVTRKPDDHEKKLFNATFGRGNLKVDVYFAEIEFLQKSMYRSYESIQHGKLSDLISPPLNFETKYKTFNENFSVLQNAIQSYTGLNAEQSKALYSICVSSHKNQPYVLWGLPGTGKTRTIVGAVRALLKMHSNTRILITAPSNASADMLAFRLLKVFPRPLIESAGVLRLYSISLEAGDLSAKLRSISAINPETDMFEIPDYEDLISRRVIICTLGAVTHLINKGIPPGFFTHIFVDDAGQAQEAELGIPIGGLATNKTSLILFGDHKQLGPSYSVNLGYKTTKEFGSPLLRYMQNYNYRWDPRVYGKLTQNYRCHSKLLSIVTQYADGHEANNRVESRPEPFHNWRCLKQKDFPFLFVSVHGREVLDPTLKSYANHTEIEVVLAYIKEILKVGGINKSDIGVICPYKYQLLELSKKITEIDEDRKITVKTIKGFQSSERKVIIISAVRTHGLGFLDCELRLNSSIMRAKNLLVIVGHKENLSKRNGPYKDFISYCKKNIVEWHGNVFVRKSIF